MLLKDCGKVQARAGQAEELTAILNPMVCSKWSEPEVEIVMETS